MGGPEVSSYNFLELQVYQLQDEDSDPYFIQDGVIRINEMTYNILSVT